MNIDHIFIFTNDNGKIADELVQFGLTEGSSRVHIGQGTTNRKFYFENFFLEILWVHNEEELKSDITKPTGLWQRADFNSSNSPFGICIVNTDETEPTKHKCGLRNLTSVEFGVSNFDETDEFIQQFLRQEKIKFTLSSTNYLILTFDDNKNGQTKEFEKINLKIKY